MGAIALGTLVRVRRLSGRRDAGTTPSPLPPKSSAEPAAADAVPPDRQGTGTKDASDLARDALKIAALSCAAGALSYVAMTALGPVVIGRGPALDEPLERWAATHQVAWWAAVMERLGKIGNTWTTWGAAGTAAACLGISWRKDKWLPPAVLSSAILVDHYATLALRHRFGRPGPPTSPLGTYPSGGCDRIILFYGLIADMLWREFSGSEAGRTWAIGTVAALSFNEAYTRYYLGKHWFTDIASGLFYGALLFVPYQAAVREVAGSARGAAGDATRRVS
jgi:membrane-associated phospholipid phosphatase